MRKKLYRDEPGDEYRGDLRGTNCGQSKASCTCYKYTENKLRMNVRFKLANDRKKKNNKKIYTQV